MNKLETADTCFVVIDIQEKLIKAMADAGNVLQTMNCC